MKKQFLNYLLLTFVCVFTSINTNADEKYELKKKKDKNGYEYEYVTNDPRGVRIYTLKNGLKVYLSVNKNEPRIQTFIAVRAGSTFDPKETTGLAHYLEHMMFKGTSKIGTLDWEKESKLLKQISDLYEKHKSTQDPEKKKEIYKEIDSISAVAAKLAVASEYDKMMVSLGAKGTNAFTSNEKTVYVNNIPSNELEKWLKLEYERFSTLVLRLFHTELETVYEEFNMSQDNDRRKIYAALMDGLFPKHPYGQQTTIGKAEHLKNPSMINIHNYWNNYYVPNNMAIAISGDLNFENTVLLIDKYFGKFDAKKVNEKKLPKEEPITKPVVKEVVGPTAENMMMAFRFEGKNTKDEKMVTLIDMLLNNSVAGLIDLNLVQQQKVLRAGCYPSFNKEYGMHTFYAYPKKGQTLEETKDLLLGQIEKIKKGEFPDWLIQAVINDLKLNDIRRQESQWGAMKYVDAFTCNIPWVDMVNFYDDLEKISKQDLVKFANENYKNNYVVAYKRTGEDTTVAKVDKPQITPVPINRENQSEFFEHYLNEKSERLEPAFLDFDKLIKKEKLSNGIEINYIKNNTNDLFELFYIIDMGKFHNINLPVAVNLLPYLGTSKYSPSELKQEFYKLGVSMGVSANDERCYVYISGLKESFEKGAELLEHVLAEVKPDEAILKDYVKSILKKREDAKKDKNTIIYRGLLNYGHYGKENPFTNILSESELNELKAETLTDIIKDIFSFEHYLFYYGSDDFAEIKKLTEKYHKTSKLKPYPEPKKFEELVTDKDEVYFVDYDMVQTQIIMISSDQMYDPAILPYRKLYGEYFGSGLSSVVFQEIRESRALAYSAYSQLMLPKKKDRRFYVMAFVATQADKLKDATDAMLGLMNNMPKAEKQFNNSRDAIIKQIETERLTKSNIFWNYRAHKEYGLNYDTRKGVYEKMKTITIDEFEQFFNKHIKGKKFTFLVIGKKDQLDLEVLKKLGEFKELTLEDVFNY